jgi:quinol monooxygenase YgiN
VITFISHLHVAPENTDDFETLITYVTDMSYRHEAGIAYYDWAKSADEADTYVVVEVYRDAEAHAAHMASDWVRESLPKSAALIEGRPHIRQYVSGGSQPVRRSVEAD